MSLRVLVVPFLGLAMSGAWASQGLEKSVAVTASVPAKIFEVTAADGWWDKPVALKYNKDRRNFEARTDKILVRSSTGPVMLKYASEQPWFYDAQGVKLDKILYRTFVGTTLVGMKSIEIASASDAARGKEVELITSPLKATSDAVRPSVYTAVVGLLFENAAP